MKRAFLIICFFVVIYSSSFATYWVGRVTADVNLREGPSTSSDIIIIIPNNAYVFYDDEELYDGFYFALYFDEGIYGFISADYVVNKEEVEASETGELTFTDVTESDNAEVYIENKLNTRLTVKVNNSVYYLEPHSEKRVEMAPCIFKFVASSPDHWPAVGSYSVLGRRVYTWEFYDSATKPNEK